MKKILLASLFTFTLLLCFAGVQTFAEDTKETEKIDIQSAVRAYVPGVVYGTHYVPKTVTVRSSHGGSNHFTFRPGDGKEYSGYEGTSRSFTHTYKNNTYKEYTISARVTNMEYGPSPWAYGTARISY
ncbi:hypothetical protein OPHB3_2153 [Oceanobacillus picturae]|uniref:Uncharacterized protein n=2 Tax=Oceanobacillus TaxID=182709 RepID=W9AGT0_9BACI|nr:MULTISPECIES: hypothetical protein [Oceanobacillus]MCG3417657.1 hypothetical protein [Oceanobacillus jordanicus]RIU92608.1 hypothetical protein D1864_08650 [Oceanobacillus picturae]GAQ18214.1 hypothetical protein OPHB3_2153 [Oceanobacillus picturae]CDO04673.1 hypothetical protein BN988_03238 [Oceanobacillus picturae]